MPVSGLLRCLMVAAVFMAGCSTSNLSPPSAAFMLSVPAVEQVARSADSYPFCAADRAREPVDLAASGFVEEEYFLTGSANVYTLADGSLKVKKANVPYTNRILIRRPAAAEKASGVVFVDIYNASNGYDIEDMWRRYYRFILREGHTYVGVTSKPINVDALYHFDMARYRKLSWYDEPAAACQRYQLLDFSVAGAMADVPCTESGLVWDIITQTGMALRNAGTGGLLLGGATLRSLFLVGQSQSALYLNTWVNHFHREVTAASGGKHLFDGYLSAAGNWLERAIRDGEFQNGGAANPMGIVPGPAQPVDSDVPWISVDSEADTALFAARATMPRALAANSRVWQIVGSGHTWSMSPVVPDNAELIKAGRPARIFPQIYTLFPLEPAMIAAAQALIENHQQGRELPQSRWFTRNADGSLRRDGHRNVLGGVRYGVVELPLAAWLGFSKPQDMNGVTEPISLDEFSERWLTRADYLKQLAAFDDRLRAEGYLTPLGQAMFVERAGLVMDRIGVSGLEGKSL